jgi:hypothetical protein
MSVEWMSHWHWPEVGVCACLRAGMHACVHACVRACMRGCVLVRAHMARRLVGLHEGPLKLGGCACACLRPCVHAFVCVCAGAHVCGHARMAGRLVDLLTRRALEVGRVCVRMPASVCACACVCMRRCVPACVRACVRARMAGRLVDLHEGPLKSGAWVYACLRARVHDHCLADGIELPQIRCGQYLFATTCFHSGSAESRPLYNAQHRPHHWGLNVLLRAHGDDLCMDLLWRLAFVAEGADDIQLLWGQVRRHVGKDAVV